MKTLITLCFTFGIVLLQAQNFEWAKRLGGTSPDAAYAVATDASGNVYSTGIFNGTVDFDEGPGEAILTSAGYSDIFIARHDASGNLVWVKQIGGDKEDYANDISIDGSGNVLTTGSFRDTVDFDPGPGVTILSIDLLYYSPSGTAYVKGSDLFISKLDPDGNFIYAKQIGGNLSDYGSGIAIDGDDNVYTVGEFAVHFAADSADFDPGPGTFNMGTGGGFIVKLNTAGDFSWAKRFGYNTSGGSVCGNLCSYFKDYSINFESVAVDGGGNVITTGSFTSTNNDWDPLESTCRHASLSIL